MNIPETTDQEALLAICLFAAFADGDKSEVEREEVRRIAEESGFADISTVTRKILMGKISLSSVIAGLSGAQDRRLAYELALGVCEAGGIVTDGELEFLQDLRAALGLDGADAVRIESAVAALAFSDVDAESNPPLVTDAPDNSGMILKYSILNGALEILPDSLATVAIIPMQIKMVYRIGRSHGVELEGSHIKDFLATAGVGMGSQVLEGFARKLLRGLGKRVGGKLAGRAASQMAGSGMSFASTFAIGHIADKYYSAGRRLDTSSLSAMLGPLRDQARELHTTYLPQIQERARLLKSADLLSLVRSEAPV